MTMPVYPLPVKVVSEKLEHYMQEHPDIEFFTPSTEHSAGIDLRAVLDEPLILEPKLQYKIHTGIQVAIPIGFMGLIIPRSSSGVKKKLHLANTTGVIDSDYRGEIFLFAYHRHHTPIRIEPYERVMQLVVVPYMRVKPEFVDELPSTRRGEKGFGSTGSH